ncbi:uncharacterized protein SAPINGB_P005740 [Magnusiomyces paraingens]|uniref:Uncharacterized protein n=1 Tax=Magnusiomyces paraingens TaxID=2606893 RepID=A0A5E8C1H5_9ASCO|nr:uncharacterized protein SAPINGB_P005740 [Saprochaete ingens]VVT57527.1 unnamed protein product [Saprochaete ingens]
MYHLDHHLQHALPSIVLYDEPSDDDDEEEKKNLTPNQDFYQRMSQITLDRFLVKSRCIKGITEPLTYRQDLALEMKNRRSIIYDNLRSSIQEFNEKLSKSLESMYFTTDPSKCPKTTEEKKCRKCEMHENPEKTKDRIEAAYRQALDLGVQALVQNATKKQCKLEVKEASKVQRKLESVQRQKISAYYRMDKGDCLRRGLLRNMMVKKVRQLGQEVLEEKYKKLDRAREAEKEKFSKAKEADDELYDLSCYGGF